MEEELRQLYEAMLKMNEKMAQLDSKNEHLESLINAMSQYFLEKEEGDVTEQETVVLDPFTLGGFKNVSTPNGSVLRVRSKGMCVNGRHSVDESSAVFICSKCNGIVCDKHDTELSPPLCLNCIKDQIRDLDQLHVYLLSAVNSGIAVNYLRKGLKGSYHEFNTALQKLLKEGYLERDLLFRKILTTKGSSALILGSKVYDISFMQ